MKKFISAAFIIFTSFHSYSQPGYFYITGKVIDADSKTPLPAASVFTQNTTFGTTTDSSGNFKLSLPNGGYDLVVSYTDHSTESRRISSADAAGNILVELKQKDKSLDVVSVVASNEVKDGWERYGLFFGDNFIGKTKFSANCHIVNHDVLKFYFSKKRNRLKVLADEAVEIQNDALGYKIKYRLDSFTYDYITQTTYYTGYPLFEEMQPADDAQKATWYENRLKAYEGSMLHFMKSVYSKALKEDGFEIQFVVKDNDMDTALKLKNFYAAMNYKKDDSSQTVTIRPNQPNVAVIYNKTPDENYLAENDDAPKKYQLSIMTITSGQSIVIEQNGYFYDQNDITINGYWTWQKVGDMLPYDFTP